MLQKEARERVHPPSRLCRTSFGPPDTLLLFGANKPSASACWGESGWLGRMMCAGLRPLSRLGCVFEQDRLISPSQTRQSILTLPSHRALLHVLAAFDCSKAGVGGDLCEGQITNLACAPASCSTDIGCFCKLATIVRSFDGLPSCVWQGYHSFSCPLRFWPSVGLHTGFMRVVWPTRTRCRVYLSTKHCHQRYEKTTSLQKGRRRTVYAMCSELI